MTPEEFMSDTPESPAIDPRYAPKTLADCAAEFQSMMESAIKQNEFEAAATCKTFLRAVEAAQSDMAKLRESLEYIRGLGEVYVYPREWNCAKEGGNPPIEAFERVDLSNIGITD